MNGTTKQFHPVIERTARDLVDSAAHAWRVTHPDEDFDGLWAILPGNVLSAKDTRPDVHSLVFVTPMGMHSYHEGSVDGCVNAWQRQDASLRANGCTIVEEVAQ